MNKVFLIEKAPDMLGAVRNHLAGGSIPFSQFTSVNAAVMCQETPSLIVLFTKPDPVALKRDLASLKSSPIISRTPKILVLPFESGDFNLDPTQFDIQYVFKTPVEKQPFLNAVSVLTKRAPRRVFKILISVHPEDSNIRYSGVSIDFSETGMAFECTADFVTKQRVSIHFVNPRTRKRFMLKSEIVRKVASPMGDAIFYGVMFSDMSQDDIKDLISFVSGQ